MTILFNVSQLKNFRKELRNNTTPAEKKLWRYLSNKQIGGYKFRRQYSVGRYILDFYCPALKLGIEVDGPIHNTKDSLEYDQYREKEILTYGIRIIRLTNFQVLESPNKVINKIKQSI